MSQPFIVIGGDETINKVIADVFLQQDELNATSKFHPGDRVVLTANRDELINCLTGYTRSQIDAYLLSRELLELVGEVISASELSDEKSDRSKYYTVEYSVYGVNQYYAFPEHFLRLE